VFGVEGREGLLERRTERKKGHSILNPRIGRRKGKFKREATSQKKRELIGKINSASEYKGPKPPDDTKREKATKKTGKLKGGVRSEHLSARKKGGESILFPWQRGVGKTPGKNRGATTEKRQENK